MSTRMSFEDVARKTQEAFASLLLLRDYYGSSDPFQEHFRAVVQHLRSRAVALSTQDAMASNYFDAFATALERLNGG